MSQTRGGPSERIDGASEGGGGLAAGTALALKGRKPEVAVIGVQAALAQREQTGRGQWVRTSLLETALGWLSLLLAATALPYAVVKYFDASTLAGTLGGGVGMGFDTMLVLSGWHRSRDEAEAAMHRRDVRPTYVLESVVA